MKTLWGSLSLAWRLIAGRGESSPPGWLSSPSADRLALPPAPPPTRALVLRGSQYPGLMAVSQLPCLASLCPRPSWVWVSCRPGPTAAASPPRSISAPDPQRGLCWQLSAGHPTSSGPRALHHPRGQAWADLHPRLHESLGFQPFLKYAMDSNVNLFINLPDSRTICFASLLSPVGAECWWTGSFKVNQGWGLKRGRLGRRRSAPPWGNV